MVPGEKEWKLHSEVQLRIELEDRHLRAEEECRQQERLQEPKFAKIENSVTELVQPELVQPEIIEFTPVRPKHASNWLQSLAAGSLVMIFGSIAICCGGPLFVLLLSGTSPSSSPTRRSYSDREQAEHGRRLLSGEASWFDAIEEDQRKTRSRRISHPSWKRKNDDYHRTWGHSRNQYDYRSESTASDRSLERAYGLDPGDMTLSLIHI